MQTTSTSQIKPSTSTSEPIATSTQGQSPATSSSKLESTTTNGQDQTTTAWQPSTSNFGQEELSSSISGRKRRAAQEPTTSSWQETTSTNLNQGQQQQTSSASVSYFGQTKLEDLLWKKMTGQLNNYAFMKKYLKLPE